MGVGPRWFGGVFLAELTPTRPRKEAACNVQLPVLFFHVPQRGTVGTKMSSLESPVCEAVPSSLSDLYAVPKDDAGMFLT